MRPEFRVQSSGSGISKAENQSAVAEVEEPRGLDEDLRMKVRLRPESGSGKSESR